MEQNDENQMEAIEPIDSVEPDDLTEAVNNIEVVIEGERNLPRRAMQGEESTVSDNEAEEELIVSDENNETVQMLRTLEEVGTVFPSKEPSVFVAPDEDYGGAHSYVFKNCLGFNDGQTQYEDSLQQIDFVKKEESGMVSGLQSEQLLIALIDRHVKLNNKYPSANGEMAINFMDKALASLRARVNERMKRGVMGELKK